MKQSLPVTAPAIVLGAAFMLPLNPVPAVAECAGAATLDTCLVGAWRQSGGGAVEWMRRNMPPGTPLPNVNTGAQLTVYNKDGSYWSAPVPDQTTIRLQGSDGNLRIDGNLKVKARGRWSVASAMLHLCTDHQTFEGEARITVPGGQSHVLPLPVPEASGPVSFGYRCSGNTLETRKSFPGMADPMVTRFERTGAGNAGR